MNKHCDQNAKLVAEIFHGDWSEGAPAGFALRAAAHARRHRWLRRATAVAAGLMVLGSAAVFTHLRRAEIIGPVPVPRGTESAMTRDYEIISDDELLAQLRDQPLLVMKNPDGSREIVLLHD